MNYQVNVNRESAFQIGDRVQLVLDKEISPDNQLHGKKGNIIDIDFDDASSITGNHDDNFQYSVELDSGEELNMHFRRHDLKKVEP
jgi:hypothetical protein